MILFFPVERPSSIQNLTHLVTAHLPRFFFQNKMINQTHTELPFFPLNSSPVYCVPPSLLPSVPLALEEHLERVFLKRKMLLIRRSRTDLHISLIPSPHNLANYWMNDLSSPLHTDYFSPPQSPRISQPPRFIQALPFISFFPPWSPVDQSTLLIEFSCPQTLLSVLNQNPFF